MTAASARSGEAPTGGDSTATVAFPRWSTRGRSSARSRVSGEEESEGREEKQRASWWPYQRWGARSEGAGEEDTATAAAVLPLSRTGKRERTI